MNNIKRNYQKELEAILKKLPQEKVPTLLLHSCCAPCSSYCLEYLSDYFEITILIRTFTRRRNTGNGWRSRSVWRENFLPAIRSM